MSKVLVTGGNGYIGRYVVEELLSAGHRVVVASRSYEGMDPRAERAAVPIFSGAEDIYQQLGAPDVCIHLAWRNGFMHNAPSHMEDLSAHIRFCNDMMRGGLPILSCLGSMHEVGYWEGPVDENTPCAPQTQYGVAKNAMRESLLLSSRDTGCVFHWLRAYYIVSETSRGSNIFSKLLLAAERGETAFPFTSGKNRYDFIDIRELTRLIVLVSLQTRISGVTNVCSGTARPLGEQIEAFIRDRGLSIRLDYGKYPDRPYDSPAIWGDDAKLRKILALAGEEK